jgi:choline kinase|tara:strand:+ start:959 stop:1735 length:777 start_codon:yes stop_codon:yes gene_type:complete
MSNQNLPKVVILAAGAGNRLCPYTNDRPKSMIELGGHTLIGRQLNTLKSCGLTDILIVTGYLKEQLHCFGYPTVNNPDWETTNMVMTLWRAFDSLKDDVIISYADIIYQRSVLEVLLADDSDISVVVDKGFRKYWEFRFKNPLDDLESLVISQKGFIESIGQKIISIDDVQAQYIGLMRFKNEGLDILKKYMLSISTANRFETMYMTDLLQELINDGELIKPVIINNCWLEIDSVNDFQAAKKKFEDGSIMEFFDPEK